MQALPVEWASAGSWEWDEELRPALEAVNPDWYKVHTGDEDGIENS